MGLTPSAISRRLGEERVTVTRQGVAAFLRRYRLTGLVSRKERRRGYGKVADHQDIVHELYLRNDELSAVDVQRILQNEHGI